MYYKAWSEEHCNQCGERFHITRTEPREIVGEILCETCSMYNKGYKEGEDSYFFRKEQQGSNAQNTQELNIDQILKIANIIEKIKEVEEFAKICPEKYQEICQKLLIEK